MLRRLLERLREAGYREVVTNALGPLASLPLVDVGFAEAFEQAAEHVGRWCVGAVEGE